MPKNVCKKQQKMCIQDLNFTIQSKQMNASKFAVANFVEASRHIRRNIKQTENIPLITLLRKSCYDVLLKPHSDS